MVNTFLVRVQYSKRLEIHKTEYTKQKSISIMFSHRNKNKNILDNLLMLTKENAVSGRMVLDSYSLCLFNFGV